MILSDRVASDEDDTDRWRNPKRAQSSDDRALQRRAMAPPLGVPVMQTPEPDKQENTTPFDLFRPERMARHRRPGDSVVALAQRLRDERPDPYDLLAQLAFEHIDAKEAAAKERRASDSQSKELERRLSAFLDVQPGGKKFDELAAAVADLSPLRSSVMWLRRSLLVVILGICAWFYARGGKETTIDIRIEELRDDVKTLKGELERRRESHP